MNPLRSVYDMTSFFIKARIQCPYCEKFFASQIECNTTTLLDEEPSIVPESVIAILRSNRSEAIEVARRALADHPCAGRPDEPARKIGRKKK